MVIAQTPSPQAPQNQPQSAPDQDQNADKSKPLPQVSPEARYDFQSEITFILQHLFPFHSPYAGPDSLRSRSETELTDTYTLYLGARLSPEVEVYVNPELAWGNGIGEGDGLAGYTNGDLIGQGSLRPEPYLARYFVRWRIPLPQHGEKSMREVQIGRAPNMIAGEAAAHRLVVTFGKFAVSDIFDVNAYANSPRQQFMNDAFVNNLAYDLAQETRGYDLGLTVVWIHPTWVIRFGTFAMPTTAGGPDLAYNLSDAHSEQIEGELHARLLGRKNPPLLARLLAYRNVATMGRYSDALAAQPPGAPPDITQVRKHGAVKYGFGLNFEQGLADGGATGVFGRFGWNNGDTESFSYAEADRFLSIGGQLSGARWKRKNDRVGLALAQSDLSGAHKNYLAAGGVGLNLGDGALRYGSERILETYYSYQLSTPIALSLDYQYIANPGYNRDRGPVSVVSLRLYATF
jgi:high affinity Mn2+ porin